jgi:hypothetical protein
MYRLSINLGASNSWNPKDLSRPVMGLLYLTATAQNNNSNNAGVSSSLDYVPTNIRTLFTLTEGQPLMDNNMQKSI